MIEQCHRQQYADGNHHAGDGVAQADQAIGRMDDYGLLPVTGVCQQQADQYRNCGGDPGQRKAVPRKRHKFAGAGKRQCAVGILPRQAGKQQQWQQKPARQRQGTQQHRPPRLEAVE